MPVSQPRDALGFTQKRLASPQRVFGFTPFGYVVENDDDAAVRRWDPVLLDHASTDRVLGKIGDGRPAHLKPRCETFLTIVQSEIASFGPVSQNIQEGQTFARQSRRDVEGLCEIRTHDLNREVMIEHVDPAMHGLDRRPQAGLAFLQKAGLIGHLPVELFLFGEKDILVRLAPGDVRVGDHYARCFPNDHRQRPHQKPTLHAVTVTGVFDLENFRSPRNQVLETSRHPVGIGRAEIDRLVQHTQVVLLPSTNGPIAASAVV